MYLVGQREDVVSKRETDTLALRVDREHQNERQTSLRVDRERETCTISQIVASHSVNGGPEAMQQQ